MKRKYISMMLLGASVSMITPTAPVMAEEPAGNILTDGEDVSQDAQEELGSDENTGSGEGPVTSSFEPERAGYADRLTEVYFDAFVFGDLQTDLVLILETTSAEGLSLYEYEKKVFEKIEKLGLENTLDVQYYVALAFEEVYGADAEKAGREIRIRITNERSGKDHTSELEGMEFLYEVDTLMGVYAGIPVKPSENAKTEVKADNNEENKDDGEDQVNPEDEGNKDDVIEEEEHLEAVKLSDYVSGLGDITMNVGDEIPSFDNVSFDQTYVSEVTRDVSNVDPNTEGTYTYAVTIKGVDGSEEKLDFLCVVNVNTALVEKRDQMKEQIDQMDASMLKGDILAEWQECVSKAKEQIDSFTGESDMRTVVDSMTEKLAELQKNQEIVTAKEADKEAIFQYYNTLTFSTSELKAMADAVVEETTKEIGACETIGDATRILDEGKAKLDAISHETEEVISALKKNAKQKIEDMKQSVSTGTDIEALIGKSCMDKIEASTDAKEISGTITTAQALFDNLAAAKIDLTKFADLFKNMKGLAADSETSALLDEIALQAAPENMDDAMDLVEDACKSLSTDTSGFITYLSGKAGDKISGSTKTDAYKNYVEFLKNGGLEGKLKLEKARKESHLKIQSMVDKITDSEIKATAQEVADKAIEEMTIVMTVEDVSNIEKEACEKIDVLIKAADEKKELQKVKNDAIAEIDKVVNAQTDPVVKEAVSKMADTAKKNIKEAKSADQVKKFLAAFTEDAIVVINEKKAELAKAKSDALSRLSELLTAYDSSYVTAEAQKVLTDAKTRVNNATTVEECTAAYTDAKGAFDSACLKSMQSAYVNKLQALLTGAELNEENLTAARAIVEKAIENINKVESPTKENVMTAVYDQAKKAIDEIVKSAGEKGEALQKIKDDAKKELESYVTNPSSNASKVISSYKNKIDVAKTEEEVKEKLEDAKKLLDQIGAHTSNAATLNNNTSTTTTDNLVTDPNATVEDVRSAALFELSSYVTVDSDNAKEIVDEYSAKIKAATTKGEIKELLDEAKSKIDAIGAHGDKVGEKVGEAGTKEGETYTTNAVKTGDPNESIFRIIGTAIIFSLTMIGAVIFRRSRQ